MISYQGYVILSTRKTMSYYDGDGYDSEEAEEEIEYLRMHLNPAQTQTVGNLSFNMAPLDFTQEYQTNDSDDDVDFETNDDSSDDEDKSSSDESDESDDEVEK